MNNNMFLHLIGAAGTEMLLIERLVRDLGIRTFLENADSRKKKCMKKKEDLWQYDVSKDIIEGNTDYLQRELDAGWNINEPLLKYANQGDYKLPLMLAIQSNYMASVKFLVENGALLDADPDHAFMLCDMQMKR